MQMVFQDPQASLNPRKRVAQILATPLRMRGVAKDQIESESREAGRARRTSCRAPEPVPARVLRRPAPADRDRSRARRQPAADPARRARLGARRLDPGAGDQPARRASGRVPPVLRVRGPRSERRAPRLGSDRRDVPRQADGGLAGRGALLKADPPVHVGAARAIPIPDPHENRARTRQVVTGEPPNPINPPSGCRFHTRCPRATEICRTVEPQLTEYADGHLAACHHPQHVSADEVRSATRSPATPLSAGDTSPSAH